MKICPVPVPNIVLYEFTGINWPGIGCDTAGTVLRKFWSDGNSYLLFSTPEVSKLTYVIQRQHV
jgi:hypothetical protein